MKILTEIPKTELLKESIITIGSFDGAHLGHRELFKKLSEEKEKRGLKTVVVTFFPNPKAFMLKDAFEGHLSSREEKISLLKSFNIDLLYVLKFDENLKNISASNFLKQITNAFNPSVFIVGYNHFFGYKKEGNLAFLKEKQKMFSFEVIQVAEISHPIQGKISSSKIRDLLTQGKIKQANTVLGYKYSLEGKVIKGKGLGKEINFPTANLKININIKLLPKQGVYLIESLIAGKVFLGMCNIGLRPTVSKSNKLSVEVHFFGLNYNLYGKKINISFLSFIRDEALFDNLHSLKKQLELDKNKCLEYSINNV